MYPTSRTRRHSLAVAGVAATALLATACSGGGGGGEGDDQVTITVSGPNQWNNDPQSFGPAWEDLVERFEAEEPSINVETTVLPVAQFGQTLATQLGAGTAPELIFEQTPHTPDQAVALDEYLDEPNPYAEGNERWLDLFDDDYFGPESARAVNAEGNYEFVPFNLVIVGIFFNADILAEAGVEAPIASYGDFLQACEDISDAGYTPLAMDQSGLAQNWLYRMISPQLLDKYTEEWNRYTPDNEPGTARQLTPKSLAQAILTGEYDPVDTPEVAESLRMMKRIYDECATPNWSGISGGAAFIGHDDFVGGRAAMTLGTNFATTNLDDVDWEWSTMPFPTISEKDSEYSTGRPAQFGAGIGGTNYMIPSTTEGAELEAAIKFLQFVTSPEGGQPWLDASGGLPATNDAEPAPGLESLMSGSWAETPIINRTNYVPSDQRGQPPFDGYLLESSTLEEHLADLDADWDAWALEQAEQGGWDEDWAQG